MSARGLLLTALVGLAGMGALACGEPTPTVSGARFALTAELWRADAITLVAETGEDPLEVWSWTAADGAVDSPLFVELEPGEYSALGLSAQLGEWPLFAGRSAPFTVSEGEAVEVQIVVDPVGALAVIPSGLAAVAGVTAIARPLDPLPGEGAVPLDDEEGVFSAVVPAGRYAIELSLPAGIELGTGDALQIDVVAGTESVLRPAYAPLDGPPLPVPELVEALEVEAVLGSLADGLQVINIIVEAVDADEARVPGYVGEVSFAADRVLAALALPETYRFTADDAGRHVFSADLLTALITLPLSFEVIITDADNGLEARAPICVPLPLIGGC